MSNTVQQLRSRLATLADDARRIEAEAQGRDLNADEMARIGLISNEFAQTEARISAAELGERASAPQPRLTAPSPIYGQSHTPQPIRGATSTTGPSAGSSGFGSFIEYLSAVKMAAFGKTDARLFNSVSTYGNENGPGGDGGGFAVPSDFRRTIEEAVLGEQSLVSRLSPISCSSNQIQVPIDENSQHSTSGVTSSWVGEAVAATPSAPSLQLRTVVLNKIVSLCHSSEELLEDNAEVGGYLLRVMAKKIAGTVNDAIINGNGVAKPLGLLNSTGAVSVAKESNQTATTINATNVGKMLSRLIPASLPGAFWICHTSSLPQLWTMAVSNQPVYAPSFRDSPYGGLLGLPVVVSEYAATLGTVGDLILVGADGYLCAVKAAGIQTASTIAFAFDQNLQSFRATFRIGGVPMLSAPVARKSGSDTLSSIVTLATRS